MNSSIPRPYPRDSPILKQWEVAVTNLEQGLTHEEMHTTVTEGKDGKYLALEASFNSSGQINSK